MGKILQQCYKVVNNYFAAGFARALKIFAVRYGLLLVHLQEFQALRISHVSSCILSS